MSGDAPRRKGAVLPAPSRQEARPSWTSRFRNGWGRGISPPAEGRPKRRGGGSASLACWALALALLATPALAVSDPNEMLPNAAQEQRAREIGRQLRCLVCQNESIEDSGADLARDLRHIVRQQVAAGRDEAQVIDYVHQRYGDFVLLRPPFDRATLLLWATPALALLAGLIAVFVSRRRRATEAPPLTEAERARLARLEDGTHA